MKFSVWDYSQVKIAQFNESHPTLAIDPTDIFIFTWFKGFANKTRVKSSKKDGTQIKGMWRKTIDGVDYFNVRYDAIIKDFPILGVCNIKSIQRRFDKYVEAGIFEKSIVHAGRKGNFTYFAFTELFLSFEYDNNNLEHKSLGVDKNVQTKPLGVDKNVQTLIYNPAISLNNPATSSSREINFIPKENTDSFMQAEAENIILEKLKELFGGHLVFDESFIPGILSLSKEFELEKNQIQGFLQFVFDRASEKKPNSLTNMYYKMAKSPAVIQDYVLSLQKLQKETKSKDKDMAFCPICGSRANIYGQCSCCNFDMLDRFDRKKVSIKKQIYELPKNDKEAFNREFEAELKRQKAFGVVAMLTNPTLRAEFQERLKNIYHKYGITA